MPFHLIIISILFHHYKDLKECISEAEQIGGTATLEEKMQIDLKEEAKREGQIILESYFIGINKITES